jgi:uncharacterized protein
MMIEGVEISEKSGSAVFRLKAQPRSSKSGISGAYNGGVKVNLKAAPVDDAANRECCDLFAKVLHVSSSRLTILSGKSSKNKIIKVDGLGAEEVSRLLRPYL